MRRAGVEILTLYAFSTENWRRPADEVNGLFGSSRKASTSETEELHRKNVRLRHIGSWRGSARLAERVRAAVELTRENTGLVLNVAFNYGGRARDHARGPPHGRRRRRARRI